MMKMKVIASLWILTYMLSCLHADEQDALNRPVQPRVAENDEHSNAENITEIEINQFKEEEFVDGKPVPLTAAVNQTGDADKGDGQRDSAENQPSDNKRRHGKNQGNQRRRHPHRDQIESVDANNSPKKEFQGNDNDKINETRIVGDASAPVEGKACLNCDPKQREVDYRIEMVKAQLLQKLGMSEPPKVDGPIHPLPFDFYVGEKFAINDEPDDDEDDDGFGKVRTREIFVFGDDVTNLCLKKRGAGCYSFNLTAKGINPEEVGSVELWIYKQADLNDHHIQTFVVSELSKHHKHGKEYLRSRNIVKRIETRLKYGWMKIYVNRMVLRWLSKPHRNNGLAVVCKTCKRKGYKTIFGDKEGMMPFLVFYNKRRIENRQRSKRETQCLEGGNNCCHREPLEINFRDIGWEYIMAPPSIRPNYCTGSCNGIHAAYYNHTRLVQILQQSVTHEFTPLQPCCSPVHFRRTQSLLYRDHLEVIRKIDIPDLIVGECGCT